jgi:chemotaxis-related protein WspD
VSEPDAGVAPLALDDCWNRIGVRGDRSCAQLPDHVHCRNCPIYCAAATARLHAELPAGYLDEWTHHLARLKPASTLDTRSVVIFRLADEWLALPTSVVVEVASVRPIHSLPHRQNPAVLGLANVRGELLVCVSLGRLVGVEATSVARQGTSGAHRRLLVIRRDEARLICPVDEVHGTHRFHPSALKHLPATVAKATVTYSTGLIDWQNRSVGVLDDQLLFYTVKRSLG